MKKNHINIGLAIFAAIIVAIIPMHMAHAGVSNGIFGIGDIAIGAVLNFVSFLVQIVFEIVAWILALQGALLNMSIVLTMGIKSFLAGAPGVYIVWQTLRDLSGMFVIFALLFASFKVILGLDDKVGSLITHVVIAGILINFSFFITGALIDASNIVSLSIYNQMIPAGQSCDSSTMAIQLKCLAVGFTTSGAQNKGGVSALVIQSMKVQSLLNPQVAAVANTKGITATVTKIILMQVISIIIMAITGLSFVIAACAFIVRTVLLLFLLAFSPVWFVSMIFPGLKASVSDKFWNALKSQLIFMPAYLLMLYVALRVISSMGNILGDVSSVQNLATGSAVPLGSVSVILINYAFVAIMLNLPLLVAASLNSSLSKFSGKYSAQAVMGKIGSKAGQYAKWTGGRAAGFVGTRTAGAVAGNLDKALSNTKLGNSLLGKDIRSVTTGKLAKAKMGAARSYEERAKEQKEVDKKNREITRHNQLTAHLAGKPLPGSKSVKEIIGSMNEKEKLALGAKTLGHELVIPHLKGSDFDAIRKDEENFTDDDRENVAKSRTKILDDAMNSVPPNTPVIKNMIESMDGKDLLKLDGTAGRPNITNCLIVEYLKPSQLKVLQDEGLDPVKMRNIGHQIDSWPTAHRSQGYVRDNDKSWL